MAPVAEKEGSDGPQGGAVAAAAPDIGPRAAATGYTTGPRWKLAARAIAGGVTHDATSRPGVSDRLGGLPGRQRTRGGAHAEPVHLGTLRSPPSSGYRGLTPRHHGNRHLRLGLVPPFPARK
jgi:hypothetical protein